MVEGLYLTANPTQNLIRSFSWQAMPEQQAVIERFLGREQ